jgi:hypothetical protein
VQPQLLKTFWKTAEININRGLTSLVNYHANPINILREPLQGAGYRLRLARSSPPRENNDRWLLKYLKWRLTEACLITEHRALEMMVELNHIPKKAPGYMSWGVRKPSSLICNRFRGCNELVDAPLPPCSKNAKGEHQSTYRMNPRRYEQLIEVESLDHRPITPVMPHRLESGERHPYERKSHAERVFARSRGSRRTNYDREQSSQRPLTKGTTWIKHRVLPFFWRLKTFSNGDISWGAGSQRD